MIPRLGNARLAIPRVNQNPRPPRVSQGHVARGSVGIAPNRPLRPAKVAIGNAVAVQTPATSTSQPSNAVATPATQTSPVDPLTSTPAPAQPTGLFDLPAYTPAAGQPDPRDATYWSNLAKLKFTDEQEYSKGLAEQTIADTGYAQAVQAAIQARKGQQRELGEAAIKGNLGASGWLDRNEAEQTSNYTTQRANATQEKSQQDLARQNAQAAILQSFGIDAGGLFSDAGGRFAEAQERAAGQEEPIVGVNGAAAAPGGSAYTGPSKGAFRGRYNKAPKRNPVKQAIANRRVAR